MKLIRKNGQANIQCVARLIGRAVIPTVQLARAKAADGTRKWIQVEMPLKQQVPHWITGATFCCTGYIDSDDYCSSYFAETAKRAPCLLVRPWPTAREIRIPLDTGWQLLEPWRRPMSPQKVHFQSLKKEAQDQVREWGREALNDIRERRTGAK